MPVASVGLHAVANEHVVNFYDSDNDLVLAVGRYIADGLALDDIVVVIATRAHRHALRGWLQRHEVDVSAKTLDGSYVALDAADTLAAFMVDGHPDKERFALAIEPYMREAACDGRDLRAFGEMVAVLWDEGNVTGAVELEALWNELAERHTFSLYCAYPATSLAGSAELQAAANVCSHHSAVISPASYVFRGADETGLRNREWSETFLPTAEAVGAARRFVARALLSWGCDDLIADTTVIVSELATNAVLHAGSPFPRGDHPRRNDSRGCRRHRRPRAATGPRRHRLCRRAGHQGGRERRRDVGRRTARLGKDRLGDARLVERRFTRRARVHSVS